ncbi:MAG: hypothetical protein ACPGQG_04265 [Candidatus Thalassarchaeaceae archaeon]
MAQVSEKGMSSFDVARMRVELSGMIGSRSQKAYQPHYEQVVIRMKDKGSPPVDLVIVRGKRAYLSGRDRPMPQNPSSFAMTLRQVWRFLRDTHLISANSTIAQFNRADNFNYFKISWT